MKKFIAGLYQGLGTTKAQRFWRFFLLLLLIAAVTVYGFHSDAINISLGFGVADK